MPAPACAWARSSFVPEPVPAPHPKRLSLPIGGSWLLVSGVSVPVFVFGGVSCVFGDYGGGYPSKFNF